MEPHSQSENELPDIFNDSENVENENLNSDIQCQICSKKFRTKVGLDRHRKRFTFEHILLHCCNKIEDISNVETHLCKKKQIEPTDQPATSGRDKENIEVKEEEDEEIFLKEENIDSDEDNNLPDVFDEIFNTSSKRVYNKKKKKLNLNEANSCEKCKATFETPLELKFHLGIGHSKKKEYRCSICEMIFTSEEPFKEHIMLHDPADRVVCKGCKKTFDTLKSYQVHAKMNPGKHCYPCKLCWRRFPSEFMLDQHVCVCINGKPFLCGCGKEFTKYVDVIRHSKGTKPFNCCTCKHVSSTLTAHLRHMRKHSKQKPFSCSKCDASFAVIDFLNIHIKKTHSNEVEKSICKEEPKNELLSELGETLSMEEEPCNECNAKFKTKEELKAHEDEHSERIPCPDCGKLLKRTRMQSHRNSHKASASLCPDCGKLFDTRFKLTQHMLTAHYSDPVECTVCGKVLKTKKIFNEHMKTHITSEIGTRIPQAICPICGVGLAQKGSLQRHITLMHEKHKLVVDDKPRECKECGEMCPNKTKYYSHRRMHRAMVDRFPCGVCGRVFNKKQNLRRHIYLLHNDKRVIEDPIFGCQICTRSFREKKNLRRHYRMVHKLDDIVEEQPV